MSFVNISDIAKAIKIGYWIYDKWFVKSNQADRLYLAFLSDIRSISVQLEKLGEVFDTAGRTLAGQANVPPNTIQARRLQSAELIGDFTATLEECKTLLANNQKYAKGGAYTTAKWHIRGLESDSQALRTRVQFHCTKISFIVEPLQLELLHKVSQDVTIIKEQIRLLRQRLEGTNSGAGVLSQVPEELAERFEKAALTDRPFEAADPYPLKEAVNALLFHFSQSTVNMSGYAQPSTEQFYALLKSRWILDKIIQNPEYQRLPVCLSRTVVSNVEDQIMLEYSRWEEGWAMLQLDSINIVEEDCFTIWFEEHHKALTPSTTVEALGEIKILDLPLKSHSKDLEQSILVFRQSETEFRLLRMTTGDAGVEQDLKTHTFRCVPLYAVPDTTNSTNSISICHNSVNKAKLFEMETREDVMTLQQAFTNYRVMNNCASIQWSMSRDKVYHKALKGSSGRSGIQIWHPEALERVDESAGAPESAVSDSSSDRRPSTLADDLRSRLQIDNASLTSVQHGGRDEDGVIASFRPKNPALIIFTNLPMGKKGEVPAFVYIPLESGIHINKFRCGCAAPNSNCCDVILEMNPGKRNKFKAKIHRALDHNEEPNLQDWNIFMFSDPKPEAYNSLETIDDAVELHLRFDTVRDRKVFLVWLCQTIHIRDKAVEDFHKVRAQMRVLEHKLHNGNPSFNGISPGASVMSLSPPGPQPRAHRASSSSSSTTARLQHSLTGSSQTLTTNHRPSRTSTSNSPQPGAVAFPPPPSTGRQSLAGETLAGPSGTSSNAVSPTTRPTPVLATAEPNVPNPIAELSTPSPSELDNTSVLSYSVSTFSPTSSHPIPIKPMPRRLSSKTMVNSPQTDNGDYGVYFSGGAAQTTPKLGTISDEREDEREDESTLPFSPLPLSKRHHSRVDSGAALISPLSASPGRATTTAAAPAATALDARSSSSSRPAKPNAKSYGAAPSYSELDAHAYYAELDATPTQYVADGYSPARRLDAEVFGGPLVPAPLSPASPFSRLLSPPPSVPQREGGRASDRPNGVGSASGNGSANGRGLGGGISGSLLGRALRKQRDIEGQGLGIEGQPRLGL